MEFKQVIGLRRSIRYYQPSRPVDSAEVQTILEAARLCSQAINSNWAKAIVVNRDDMDPEDREAQGPQRHRPAGHGAHLGGR
jgi:nitroreductase